MGGNTPAAGNNVTCTEEFTGPSTTFTPVTSFTYSDATGVTTVSCLIQTSAQRFKTNVQDLGPQLSKVTQLRPVEFDWTTNSQHGIGFIAEDVREIYPEFVTPNEKGEITGMDYAKMVSVLVKSIQEQQEQINQLNQKLNNLNIN